MWYGDDSACVVALSAVKDQSTLLYNKGLVYGYFLEARKSLLVLRFKHGFIGFRDCHGLLSHNLRMPLLLCLGWFSLNGQRVMFRDCYRIVLTSSLLSVMPFKICFRPSLFGGSHRS